MYCHTARAFVPLLKAWNSHRFASEDFEGKSGPKSMPRERLDQQSSRLFSHQAAVAAVFVGVFDRGAGMAEEHFAVVVHMRRELANPDANRNV